MADKGIPDVTFPVRIHASTINIGYTVWFMEEPLVGLEQDLPAMDKKGKFLWCLNKSNILNIYKHLAKNFAKVGVKKKIDSSFDIVKVLKGLDFEKRTWKYWKSTIDFVNLLLDFVHALPADDEDKKQQHLLGQLCDHMLLADELTSFYSENDTSKKEIVQIILYNCYRVYQNSRFV